MIRNSFDQYKKELALFISLIPFYIILDRILNGLWGDYIIAITLSVICIVVFLIITFIAIRSSVLSEYLWIIYFATNITGLILFIFWPGMFSIYVLSLLIVLLDNYFSIKKLEKGNKKRLKKAIGLEIFFLNGIALSLILSIFFWDNTLIIVSVLFQIMIFVISIMDELRSNKKTVKETETTNKSAIKCTLEYISFFSLIGIIPLGILIITSLMVHGFIVIIAFPSSILLFLASLLLTLIAMIFSLFHRRLIVSIV